MQAEIRICMISRLAVGRSAAAQCQRAAPRLLQQHAACLFTAVIDVPGRPSPISLSAVMHARGKAINACTVEES